MAEREYLHEHDAEELKAQDRGGEAAHAADSGGQDRLPADLQRKFGRAFGQDFASVRIHQDGRAAAMGALAFAEGDDLHFAPGSYDPRSQPGQELIGHELAHVVQQRAGRVAAPQAQEEPNRDPSLEAEADALGAKAARGEVVASGGGGGGAAANGAIQAKSLGSFLITHYNLPSESDPAYEENPKVAAPGLNPAERYKRSFLGIGNKKGVKMQGSGLAANGKKIHYAGNGRFSYIDGEIKGSHGAVRPWQTIAVDSSQSPIPYGSHVRIEGYVGSAHNPSGIFQAEDTGGAIKGQHIDVYVGNVPRTTALSYHVSGNNHSEVTLVGGPERQDKQEPASEKPTAGPESSPKREPVREAGGGGPAPSTQRTNAGGHHALGASVGHGGANHHADVRKVQEQLKQRGVDPGPIDSHFGPKTLEAIRHFQSHFLHHPDGLIEPGKTTERHLFHEQAQVTPRRESKEPASQRGGGGRVVAGGGAPGKTTEPETPRRPLDDHEGLPGIRGGVVLTEPIARGYRVLVPFLPHGTVMTSGLRTVADQVRIINNYFAQHGGPGSITDPDQRAAWLRKNTGLKIANSHTSPHLTGLAFDLAGASLGAIETAVHRCAQERPETFRLLARQPTIFESTNRCIHVNLAG